MGIDGFSMANLGLHKDVTSAQRANEAEMLATKGNEFKVQDVFQPSKDEPIEVKRDGKNAGQQRKNKKKKQDETEIADEEVPSIIKRPHTKLNFDEEDPKNYSIKFNDESELIELVDNKTKKVIETITAKDLMYLISKVNGITGVLVNKKI